MKAMNLRDNRTGQPTPTSRVTIGSSISALVLTCSRGAEASPLGSRLTCTLDGAILLSPDRTSTVTHSTATNSSASKRSGTVKLSGWPRTVELAMRPKPSAMTLEAARARATPAPIERDALSMR